ncbi:MAG: hypothetical protein AAGA81_14420, partial [Acidobacteriota bacterium]
MTDELGTTRSSSQSGTGRPGALAERRLDRPEGELSAQTRGPREKHQERDPAGPPTGRSLIS